MTNMLDGDGLLAFPNVFFYLSLIFWVGFFYVHYVYVFSLYMLRFFKKYPSYTSHHSLPILFLPPFYYRGSLASTGRRRVDRDRDFLGSLSSRAGGVSGLSEMDSSLLSTANSSSPLTLSTEDLSIMSNSGGKVNVNASATSNIKEENPESSYHQQEHKQT